LPNDTQGISLSVFRFKHPKLHYPEAKFNVKIEFMFGNNEDWSELEEEDYNLEDVSLILSDYMKPIELYQWQSKWDAFNNSLDNQKDEAGQYEMTEHLLYPTIRNCQQLVDMIINTTGMTACNGTRVPKAGSTKHRLQLCGTWITGTSVMMQVLMRMHTTKDGGGISMQMKIRSKDPKLNKLLANAFVPDADG